MPLVWKTHPSMKRFTVNDHAETLRVENLMKHPNAIFVFGSNLAGRHGAGAAKDALDLYGAVRGVGHGPQGRAYAIPTKDENINTLPFKTVVNYVSTFLDYANQYPNLTFAVTRIGCGRAGYNDFQIAPLFTHAPHNCQLPEHWRDIINGEQFSFEW